MDTTTNATKRAALVRAALAALAGAGPAPDWAEASSAAEAEGARDLAADCLRQLPLPASDPYGIAADRARRVGAVDRADAIEAIEAARAAHRTIEGERGRLLRGEAPDFSALDLAARTVPAPLWVERVLAHRAEIDAARHRAIDAARACSALRAPSGEGVDDEGGWHAGSAGSTGWSREAASEAAAASDDAEAALRTLVLSIAYSLGVV